MSLPCVTISDNRFQHTSVNLYFNKKAMAILDCKEIVIKQIDDKIVIRRAEFDENNCYKVNKTGTMSYTSENAKEFIGKYVIENNVSDEFVLNLLDK